MQHGDTKGEPDRALLSLAAQQFLGVFKHPFTGQVTVITWDEGEALIGPQDTVHLCAVHPVSAAHAATLS